MGCGVFLQYCEQQTEASGPEIIEWFIEDQASCFLASCPHGHSPSPPSRQSARQATHRKTEKERQLADGRGGGGTKLYDGQKDLSSINHSIPSAHGHRESSEPPILHNVVQYCIWNESIFPDRVTVGLMTGWHTRAHASRMNVEILYKGIYVPTCPPNRHKFAGGGGEGGYSRLAGL